jgi:hypothetical protein
MSLPVIISWGIWLARNASLFEDSHIPPIQCASRGLSILKKFHQEKMGKHQRLVVEEVVDKSGTWDYFDGVTQDEP